MSRHGRATVVSSIGHIVEIVDFWTSMRGLKHSKLCDKMTGGVMFDINTLVIDVITVILFNNVKTRSALFIDIAS